MAAGLLEWMGNGDPCNLEPHAAGYPALLLWDPQASRPQPQKAPSLAGIPALRCADFSIIRESVEAEDTEQQGKCYLYLEDEPPQGGFKGKVVDKEEFLMRRAHAVFRVCKSAMVDSSENPGTWLAYLHTLRRMRWGICGH